MRRKWWILTTLFAAALMALVGCGGGGGGTGPNPPSDGNVYMNDMVVFGFNELGMHCMNQDFSKLMVLPPFNTLRALVIRRGEEPQIVSSGVTVSYTIPGNTESASKTNFWTYAPALLGLSLAPNVRLTGSALAGNMSPKGDGRWEATGIPLTPLMDDTTTNSYALANITVTSGGTSHAGTQAVVPVSWEISCNLCHNDPAGADMDILQDHDRLHNTHLASSTPVACGSCHRQEPLVGVIGPGDPNRHSLSRAMHSSHESRMAQAGLTVECYACHPGVQTQCLRDVHKAHGKVCADCHGDMTQVASATRQPWVDEPRCGSCHTRAGFQFEEPGKLFRESRGHHGVYCTACHNTPHAIAPTSVAADNVQNIGLQGHSGTIDQCVVCHKGHPDDGFNHTLSGGD
jgi:hypothetical protein